MMPRSLSGKFALALRAMALMIAVGGLVAIHSLYVLARTTQSLAEERLERVQEAQSLLENVLRIEHLSDLLLTADSSDEVHECYARILAVLDELDSLVARFARIDNSTATLDLHHAAQLFRNTVHILARLRADALATPHVATAGTGERRQTLSRLHRGLDHQGDELARAAGEVTKGTTDDYRRAVLGLSTATRHRQELVLALLVASLFVAWLVSRYLRIRAVARLQQVSRRLRMGTSEENGVPVPADGNDEISEMASAVDQFLEEHRQLAEAQREVREQGEMLHAITNAAQSAVILVDDEDVIHFANPAAERLFGYDQGELIGSKAHETLTPEPLRAKAKKGFAEFARRGTGPALATPRELVAQRKDGSKVFVELFIGGFRKGGRWWAVGAAVDISLRKRREELLATQAETDPLTGVKNRRSFLQLAEQALERSRQEKTPLYFLMLDLDHFKAINDNHGHAAGDEVLRRFAGLCVGSLRETDLFGRLGGEEFAAVVSGKDVKTAVNVAERIRTAFRSTTVHVGDRSLDIDTSVSIGLAETNPESDSVESGLERADEALYMAKASGRNRIVTSG